MKAAEVLPPELVMEIQKYVKGVQLYVPTPDRSAWGERSGTKDELHRRNVEIYDLYRKGFRVETLAERYYLSPERIRRIIAVLSADR